MNSSEGEELHADNRSFSRRILAIKSDHKEKESREVIAEGVGEWCRFTFSARRGVPLVEGSLGFQSA